TFVFAGLRRGVYTLSEAQPAGFLDGIDMSGNLGGMVGSDVISNIPVGCGDVGAGYTFGERSAGVSFVSKSELLASTPPQAVGTVDPISQSPSFANSLVPTRSANATAPRFIVTSGDAGALPEVRVFDFGSKTERFHFLAYDPAFRGGVRTAVGDVNGDGVPDIVTAAGAGGGPHIRVFSGVDGSFIGEFFAYDAAFTGGVYVAVGDVNGDGYADI